MRSKGLMQKMVANKKLPLKCYVKKFIFKYILVKKKVSTKNVVPKILNKNCFF